MLILVLATALHTYVTFHRALQSKIVTLVLLELLFD